MTAQEPTEQEINEALEAMAKKLQTDLSFCSFRGQRLCIITKALQQARKDGARDEVTLGFRHFSDYEFVRDYFKVRLAELDEKEKEKE